MVSWAEPIRSLVVSKSLYMYSVLGWVVTLPNGGEKLENAVWVYKDPLVEAIKLKDLLAFYVPGPSFKLIVDGKEVSI